MRTGPLGVLGNFVWLVLAGWWLALDHVVSAIPLAITIIGIPSAWAHLELADLAPWPIGNVIVAGTRGRRDICAEVVGRTALWEA